MVALFDEDGVVFEAEELVDVFFGADVSDEDARVVGKGEHAGGGVIDGEG